jgi:hypothetical protein
MQSYSPELIQTMRAALDEVMTKIPVEQAMPGIKATVAECILKAAANGQTSYDGLIAAASEHRSAYPKRRSAIARGLGPRSSLSATFVACTRRSAGNSSGRLSQEIHKKDEPPEGDPPPLRGRDFDSVKGRALGSDGEVCDLSGLVYHHTVDWSRECGTFDMLG